jgi:hypothetical protein
MLMFALLLGTVLCDVAGQTCFKIGVNENHASTGLFATLGSRWIVAGVLVYAVEFTVWFAALSMTPLSLAFPFMALSYCGVVVASRFIRAGLDAALDSNPYHRHWRRPRVRTLRHIP